MKVKDLFLTVDDMFKEPDKEDISEFKILDLFKPKTLPLTPTKSTAFEPTYKAPSIKAKPLIETAQKIGTTALDIFSPTKRGLPDILLRPEAAKQETQRMRELQTKKILSPEEEKEQSERMFTEALGIMPFAGIAGKVRPGLRTIAKFTGMPKQGLIGEIKQQIGSGLRTNIKSPEFQSAAISNITKALKEAVPMRGKQEALYSAERAQRAARVAAVGAKVEGQQGYYAQLGQLKGELPKVQFESLKGKIRQPDVDALFQKIEDTNIFSPFEKITAKTGLEKLVSGRGVALPTRGEIALLSEVFPQEFIKEILAKRPAMQKLSDLAGQLINIPRAMRATGDFSAPLRQGAFLVGRPKQWLPAFRDMLKYAGSEKAYQGLIEDIKRRPTYQLMRDAKLSLTDLGARLTDREEAIMSSLPEKIPLIGRFIRGSNRAYSGFLNQLRADTFDDLVKSAEKLGVLKERPGAINDIAKFVNSATGRGDLGSFDKLAVATNGIFFSPRLIVSRLNLLNPIYYVKLDPFVRKEALKSLFTFASTAGTIMGLSKLGGAQVGTDSRSADFLKIKTGNTRYDVLGGFQQYMVAATRLMTNQMVSSTTGKEFNLGEGWKPTTRMDIIRRFFEGKSSPVVSFAMDMIEGKTFGGEKVDVPAEVARLFVPMLAEDMYDLYKEKGLPGIFMGLPGVFGLGSQTYGEQIPLESKTLRGKPTIQWKQKPGLVEDIVNKLRGVEVKPVPVKAKYDEIQNLMKQNKGDEAQKILDSLSDNDYELYKKFKQRDKRIAFDELKIKIKPVYQKVRELVKTDKKAEAQKIVDNMTDDEYKAYRYWREINYKDIQ